MPFRFTIQKKASDDTKGSLARAGVIDTPHGQIETPAFVTVGTKAAVKGLTPEQVVGVGAQVLIANTYHLYMQPGENLVRDARGLGKFMNWEGPTMTDSGGFQVFSLGAAYGKNISKILKGVDQKMLAEPAPILSAEEIAEEKAKPKIVTIDYDGVAFKSPLDGSIHYFTPERSIEIQHKIGADIIFAFDECTSPTEPIHYQTEALDRTHRWALRSLEYHNTHKSEYNPDQALFGIVQGGRHEELRKESARYIGSLDFDGFGIGGSFDKEDMGTAVKWVNEILPEDKPRHLLGIGEPLDLFMAVENGCDLFDCVAPTRVARHGSVYTSKGRVNLGKAEFINDMTPIEPGCECYTCQNFTKAYLAHLFRSHEILSAPLASIHNLYFIINLVKKMRQGIIDGTFTQLKKEFFANYRV